MKTFEIITKSVHYCGFQFEMCVGNTDGTIK